MNPILLLSPDEADSPLELEDGGRFARLGSVRTGPLEAGESALLGALLRESFVRRTAEREAHFRSLVGKLPLLASVRMRRQAQRGYRYHPPVAPLFGPGPGCWDRRSGVGAREVLENEDG